MVPPPRSGTFSPSPAQALQTGSSHATPHPASTASLQSASPVTGSPTGTSSVSKIVIAQVFVLLSSIKEEKDDPSKWEQLRKLIDDSGMDVFTKYFTRLVTSSASQIFPGLNRPVGGAGTYQVLTAEMHKILQDPGQARRIAESIEIGNEDIFRDFDLSTFMEHFKLDALAKTALALAFKLGPRSDLKTKADAILSTNFPSFVNILAKASGDHEDLGPDFISFLVDRFIQFHPPNFNAAAKNELSYKTNQRYDDTELKTPPEVLAALDLVRMLADQPANSLALYIQHSGADFTRSEDACVSYLQSRSASQISEEHVAIALMYTSISQTYVYNPSILVAGLRRVLPASFRWADVVTCLDQPSARISPPQFLRLYNALVPIARDDNNAFDIQHLWGGSWNNPETQLSFLSAFSSLSTDQLDATTIPGIQPTFTVDDYASSLPEVRERAAEAAKHPLVSLAAISSILHVALHSHHASSNVEAKRLFQSVVIPNLDIFVVSAFGVPKPWPDIATETLNSLFERFLYKNSPNWDFVFESLWRKDKDWVTERLITAHASQPGQLPLIFEHATKHNWLAELIYLPNGFGLDLVAYAHGEGYIDLSEWAKNNANRSAELAAPLLQFLLIKSDLEGRRDDSPQVSSKDNAPLKVRTVSALLGIVEDFLPTTGPIPTLVQLQRQCIAVYPRLINYGEGFDDVIEARESTSTGHALPQEANAKMEENIKKMYNNVIEVREVVRIMDHYKKSRDPLEQDIFTCMINSLFEEYSHLGDYPLEALATTAVLFGGLISHKLISDLPLKVGLGMILEAVRDHPPDHPMFKFGMQALMQLYARFREWPGFCRQLLQCTSLQGTDAWKKAEDVVRDNEEEAGHENPSGDFVNGNLDESAAEQHYAPFVSISVDPSPPSFVYEDPDGETQGKIQFVLNNITESTLQSMFAEIQPMFDAKYQQWFASHLVEERAKMQPNYHNVYLQLVNQFDSKALWAEVLRETFVSVARMLNSEATMQNSTERTHLKNLGGWLGLLTLARDKPILHRNIAFKQLLMEAHDTKRLIVVIPFVCKVLSQGTHSNVFKPPNPWLMDIIHLLIDLYHNAELKLNLKFEIEVLCQTLSIDHKSIEPSGEILNRMALEHLQSELQPDGLEPFDDMSLNGLAHGVVGSGAALSAHSMVPNAVTNTVAAMVAEVADKINVPPVSEMVVTAQRLETIVREAITRALEDIIQPVVDRSVAIAAIATQQMIHKDFATEHDENRVRTAAVNMAKATAGSLALVTSKDPLRANFTNYMRTLSNGLPQGLPEGTIIMCVNSNMDYASSVIERATQERAAFEIEEMIEPEIEARRRHSIQRPNEPYVDPSLSRWAMAIPNPYKLSPSMGGLNAEQMAIYDDFARHPRPAPTAVSAAAQVSDAPRTIANDILQDQYSSLPNVPTPAETPSISSATSQLQAYNQLHGAGGVGNVGALINGRQGGQGVDVRTLTERVSKLVVELQRVAAEASEQHFSELPRPHPVLDLIDAVVQTIIKGQQAAEDLAFFTANQVCPILMNPAIDDSLAIECLVHVLETLRKIAGSSLTSRIGQYFQSQPGAHFMRLPLLSALMPTGLLDWSIIDSTMAMYLKQRKEGSLVDFRRLVELTLLNDTPLVLYAQLLHSLAEAWAWIDEDANAPGGQELKAEIMASAAPAPTPDTAPDALTPQRKEQMEYVFEEWTHLCHRQNVPESISFIFLEQLRANRVLTSREDLFTFIRLAVDKSVDRFDLFAQSGGPVADAYMSVDSLARFITVIVQAVNADADDVQDGRSVRAELLDSILALLTLVLNHHFVRRGTLCNLKVFFRLFSVLVVFISDVSDQFSDTDRTVMLLKFARRINDLGPETFPFFMYPWIELVKHRILVPALLRMPGNAGSEAFTQLLRQLLRFTSEQLMVVEASNVTRDLYRSSLKLLLILYHDFPDYLAANHVQLCQSLSPYLVQPLNVILFATPSSVSKLPDPTVTGLRLERMEEISMAPDLQYDPLPVLSRIGLVALLDQALETGPSEEIVAHIKYAIAKTDSKNAATTWPKVPLSTNMAVVDAVVVYIGNHATARAQSDGPVFTANGADVATLSMVLHELSPEGRYYFIVSMVNQLRYPNSHTNFFGLSLLEIFGRDMSDPEETEIREQICRVLFERILNYWPQPWGLMAVIAELVKNEKYFFFDLPFIKVAPELSQRFASVARS